MLALTLIPGEAWASPRDDANFRGFDANLMSTSGTIHLARDTADGVATADSLSTINFLTTLRRTLHVSVDASILANAGATQPLRIGVWSPWTGSGYFVAFGPAPENRINFETVIGGKPATTLIGGKLDTTTAGRYRLNENYQVTFLVDRTVGVIRAAVSGNGTEANGALARGDSPGLFGNVQLSLTASASAGSDVSHFILSNYTLALPHERSWSDNVNDPRIVDVTIGLASLGIVALVASGLARRRQAAPTSKAHLSVRFLWLSLGAAALYLGGNIALFRLGGHPFDFANEQMYAYVAKVYGPKNLYFIPDLTSLASTWGGIPWVEASFSYEPVFAYLFAGIGWLSSSLSGGAQAFGAPSSQLGNLIKLVNVAFGLADGALIYLILRELKVGERWTRIGAGLFVFNPAVWFSMSIWGQTHVVSIFFVLLAILFAQRHIAFWAWLSLAAACLTRPQMVVFGLLLGVAFLRKFTLRENVAALSLAVVAVFVALAPLTLQTSPSLPVDILRYVFHVQEAGGNQASLTTVSQSAYSVWPLVTFVFHNASGMGRSFIPSATSLFGSITYQAASQVLTIAALLAVTAALLVRKRSLTESGGYLPLVTVGVTSFLMLLTGVVSTHFLLALPLLLLCRRWMDSIAYCFVVLVWTVSTLVPMYGDMGTVISSSAYPLLAPENNSVTNFIVRLYAWDRFITVAVVANLCAVIWLAVLAYRPTSISRTAKVSATV